MLITGGRAPATLELVRLMHRRGHEVHMAESMWGHLCQFSAAVRRNHRVPPPRQQPVAFVAAMADIIDQHAIDAVLPTCEEVFWVARGHATLSARCLVLTPDLDSLRPLHSKASFPEVVRALGFRAPDTRRVVTLAELRAAAGPEVVLKPEYSRFATHTLIGPVRVPDVTIGPDQPWVVQERLRGRHLCSWSTALNGRLTAHAVYPVTFTAGKGSAIAFSAEDHPGILELVRTLAAARSYTGQLAFDFVEVDGVAIPIECNPRLTSGVHLFGPTPEVADAILGLRDDLVTPTGHDRSQLLLPMLLYGLPSSILGGRLRAWLATVLRSREVSFAWSDLGPTLLQGVSAAVLLGWAARHRVDPLAASTLDIEWNGEP